MFKKILFIGTLLGFLAAGVLTWSINRWVNSPASQAQDQDRVSSAKGKSNPISFEVKPGESFVQIQEKLVSEHLISNLLYFKIYSRLSNARKKVKAGDYELSEAMSPREMLEILESGKSVTFPFTISEGLNIYEIAILFEKAGYGTKADFIKACFNKANLKALLGVEVYSCEGYVFPETYGLARRTSAEKLIETAVALFLKVYKDTIKSEPAGWTRDKIVTLASIIEKETGATEERPRISSVFHNRLNKKMRLQTDPTVLYGILDETKTYSKNITKQDLQTPTPFNTYTNEGLPIGPISNPGRLALQAAVQPESTEFLYFVSKNEGTHVFTKTYEDHLAAVHFFQQDPLAREGKSWRDLSKRKGDSKSANSN